MRRSSAVFRHEILAGETACPTNVVLLPLGLSHLNVQTSAGGTCAAPESARCNWAGGIDFDGHPTQAGGAVAGAYAPSLLHGFGLAVTADCTARERGWRAVRRPTCDGLLEAARQAPANGMDEAGCMVGGQLHWLHVAVSAQVTLAGFLRLAARM